MSLIAELKRRSVLKVGGAYLVVAWLSVQAASIAFPTFEAPAWALRVFIFVTMLGFPLALVMAWMFDVTPEGIKVEPAATGNKRMYAIAGAIALLAVVWFYKGQPSYKADDPQAAGTPSVAVLPFANLSGDPAQEFFSDGMTEEILNVLVKIPDLKVAARTSVFEFKGKGGDVREIGRKLGVTHIVEGSIRRDATTVRITAQLIRVADGFHVWSETYDRELKGVFALQDEIAQRIASQLKGSLAKSDAPAARAGIDPAAYDDYLEARTLYRARRQIPKAIAHLQAAVAKAPDFAAAWATLSLNYEISFWFTTPLERQALGEALPQMREAAARASALEPESAMTLHALGNVARGEMRYAEAEALYRRAIAIDPTYPDVREDLAELLIDLGDAAGSLKETNELVALEPFAWIFWNRLRQVGLATQDAAMVEDASRRVLEIDADQHWANLAAFDLAVARGDRATAGDAMEAAHREAPSVVNVNWALWRWSQHDPAIDDAIARAAIRDNIDYSSFAALRGADDLFFESLALSHLESVRYNTYAFLVLSGAPRLLADPRAKKLLRERGFEAYWRAKGWPARCKPKGEKDFECR